MKPSTYRLISILGSIGLLIGAVVVYSNLVVPTYSDIQVLKDKQRMCIRAIRITPEILEAAKAYKKDKGVSFYRLGLEAISERLVKEGYLKETAKPKD